ncbi:UNVERIFIED_CONTAM: hypothetical protein HDU68_008759 [Siphonaria sp. JEL0065]|nr:hypothetical protein HDU68_008759 [Siphonaria sp. JEL0065]
MPIQTFGTFYKSWKLVNPEYKYNLWSDDDNLNLIQQEYPWFLDTFLGLNSSVMKADAARIFYMHKFGGVYVDLDSVAYKSIDPLLSSHSIVLARMWVPPTPADINNSPGPWEWEQTNQIPNAWMASVPGHPFWMHYAQNVMDRQMLETKVETYAGPVMLWKSLNEYFGEEVVKTAGRLGLLKRKELYIADPGSFIRPLIWYSVF